VTVPKNQLVVLVAEDDPDDRQLLRDAFGETGYTDDLRFVHDGEELLDYLMAPEGGPDAPLPHIILLDFNLPRKDGREVLVEIKRHPRLRKIPVIVLTTSSSEHDISFAYETGANSFITKPVTFGQLCQIIQSLSTYWFQTVDLPHWTDGGLHG
jgi:two-component system response regulator